MSRVVNSFALLGDEEDDDVTVLIDHVVKKVEATAAEEAAAAAEEEYWKTQAQNQYQQGNGYPADFRRSDSVRSERGRGRGGQARGSGRGGGYDRNQERFGNEQEIGYRCNYSEGSNGNGYGDNYRGRGRGGGGNRGRGGRGRGFNNENVIRDEKEGSGGNENTTEEAAEGWVQVRHAPVKEERPYMNNNTNEVRQYRNGNRNYGGEWRGYGGGYNGFKGRRDDGRRDYGRSEQSSNSDVKENVDSADSNVVNVESNNATSEGDAAPVTQEPREDGAEQKIVEGSVNSGSPAKKDRKGAGKKDRKEADIPAKNEIKEEYVRLFTLGEYQKIVAEKRKALDAQKNEERKVTADKEFEAMKLYEKKKIEEEVLLVTSQKPETANLKKKDSLEKVEKSHKKPEAAKLSKKDSLEKDTKNLKTVSISEFLKPEKPFYRHPARGRGIGPQSGDFRNGDFRNNGDRAEQGRGFRNNGDRAEQGRGFRNNDDRAEQGRGFRNNSDRAAQVGGFRNNGGHTEQGEGLRNNRYRAEQGGFRNNNGYPREGSSGQESPVAPVEDIPVVIPVKVYPNIQFEDEAEFPSLKGTAPAV